jgi:hypothetical protein
MKTKFDEVQNLIAKLAAVVENVDEQKQAGQ